MQVLELMLEEQTVTLNAACARALVQFSATDDANESEFDRVALASLYEKGARLIPSHSGHHIASYRPLRTAESEGVPGESPPRERADLVVLCRPCRGQPRVFSCAPRTASNHEHSWYGVVFRVYTQNVSVSQRMIMCRRYQ